MLKNAIFLDRDGVIIKSIYDEKQDTERAPCSISEVEFIPNAFKALKEMYSEGYSLFILTNQPDFAKGFVSLDTLKEIRKYVFDTLIKNDIGIRDDYYCFHHPDYCACMCRKPSPHSLIQASEKYKLDLKKSWMIGDRNTDIVCGINAGTKTIKISKEKSNIADFTAKDLKESVEIIKFCNNLIKKE